MIINQNETVSQYSITENLYNLTIINTTYSTAFKSGINITEETSSLLGNLDEDIDSEILGCFLAILAGVSQVLAGILRRGTVTKEIALSIQWVWMGAPGVVLSLILTVSVQTTVVNCTPLEWLLVTVHALAS